MVNSWKNSSGLKSFPNQKNGRRHHLPRIVLPSAAGLATASPLYGTLAHSTLAHITTASPLYGTLAHAVQHTPEYETQLPCLFLHRLGSGCCYSPIHLQQVAIMQIISYSDAPPKKIWEFFHSRRTPRIPPPFGLFVQLYHIFFVILWHSHL